MRIFSFITILFFAQILSSQTLNFSFESDSLSGWQQGVSGRWGIDSLTPISGQKSMHHIYDSPEGSYDVIARQHDILYFDSTATSWEFKIRYSYTPSSSNNWAFWLASDQGVTGMNPSGSASGYVVGVNFTGSDDMLKIWLQNESSTSVILNTNFNWQDSITAGDDVALKIERTISGEWTISINELSEGLWNELGKASETSIVKSEYFGIYYEYSSTQDRKLWIDDISIQGLFYKDVYPPAIKTYNVVERNEIQIFFTEEIDTSKQIQFLLNSVSQPVSIIWEGLAQVKLKYSGVFSLDNDLVISGLYDNKGNLASDKSITFNYYEPVIYDVIVTEILADPFDSVGMPESEFFEILNRANYPINLEGWEIRVGENRIDLPNKNIYPNTYYIITGDKDLWGDYIDSLVINISSLPSLPNDGSTIQIYDRYNKFISGIEYSSGLYETEYKQEGGWSLELIDIENSCLIEGNWKESHGESGGTPGMMNSVNGSVDKNALPEIQELTVLDSFTIRLNYSVPMDSLVVVNQENYMLDVENNIVSITTAPPFFQEVQIVFEKPLEADLIYNLSISEDVSSCYGSLLEQITMHFGLPKKLEVNELVFNEVLYESNDEVPEFIELFNLSGYTIELKNCALALLDLSVDDYSKSVLISSEHLQVLPGEYLVFTEDKEQLLQYYPDCNKRNTYELDKWLLLSNDGAILVLISDVGERVDLAVYSPDMHFSLLYETSGVSLEKVSPNRSGLDARNWHSASSDVNYATPTLKNSQFIEDTEITQSFHLSPKEISPDNDGIDDMLNIQYEFQKPGFLVTIKIFNRNGLLVKDFVNNELCGTSGSFTWNGLSEDDTKLSMGYYIVMLEAIHPEGEVIQEKKTILMLPEKK